MLSFLSKHSTREPGVCRDEIGIALAHKQGAIATILAESVNEIKPPPHVASTQWLDLSDWSNYWDATKSNWSDGGDWFAEKVQLILGAIEKKKQFAGDLQKLQEILHPLQLSSKIGNLLGKAFVGRQWLIDQIDNWRVNDEREQRVFCLTAEAGMGKSAVMARLSLLAKGTVLGVHFCEYDLPSSRQPDSLVRTLAFQLAARLPDYRTLLLYTLQYLDKSLGDLTANELFERLLLNPLGGIIDGGQENFLILIDALDEAQPEVADLLANMANLLPKQISLVVSSRPERALLGKLSEFPLMELKIEDSRNQSDIGTYIDQWFERLANTGFVFAHREKSKQQLLLQSEGNILYLVHAEQANKDSAFDLNKIEHFPKGLSGLYTKWFVRQFGSEPQSNTAWEKVYALLELVTSSPLPVPRDLASEWLNFRGQDEVLVCRPLGSLLRRDNESFSLCHRSLAEWLQDRIADVFWINPLEARKKLAVCMWQALPESLNEPGIGYVEWALAMLLPKISSRELCKLVHSNREVVWECLGALAYKLNTVHTLEGANIKRGLQESTVTLMLALFGAEHPDTLASQNNLALTLQAQGDLAGARVLLESVLAVQTRTLGAEHPSTLTGQNNLALTLQAQGDLAGARVLLESVLAVQTRTLGVEHPDTLTSQNNLAMTLQAQGDLDGARVLLESVLAARTKTLGAEHPSTLTVQSNLAMTLQALGDLAGARVLQESVLAVQTRTLGAEHPATVASQNNLALTLQALGDLDGARVLLESVLAARTKTLATEHPDTLASQNNLARTLQAQGDLAGARVLLESALAVQTRTLGVEHPSTLAIQSNLAMTLQAQGDLAGARVLFESVLAVQTRTLGVEHPNTLTNQNNLALTLQAQGDLAGARVLLESVLAVQTRTLGVEHPSTLASQNNLAMTLQALGDLAGARVLIESVLAVLTRTLGAEHPDTLMSQNNLARTLQAQGDLAEARVLFESVLAVLTRTLGADHPATLMSQNNLAMTLQAQGDLAEARDLQESVLAVQTRTLGAEHPATLINQDNLARTLQAQGDLAGARVLFESVLAARTKTLGAEHPDTLTSQNNLAMTLQALGDLDGARVLLESVLAVLTRTLGAEHPSTLTVQSNLAMTLQAQGDLAGACVLLESVLPSSTPNDVSG
jgi:tetratricopeptide (TPR) repeat protein